MAGHPHYRPLKVLKVAILLLMGGLMLIQGVQLYYEFLGFNYVLQLKNGVQLPPAVFTEIIRKQSYAQLDFITLSIPTAVVFLNVLFRLRKNVEALGIYNLPISAGWTIGYFVIPILNLFRPFQAVRDLWRASQPSDDRWQMNPVSPTVGIWWSLWIVTVLSNCVGFFFFFAVVQTFDETLMNAMLSIVVSIMTIILIALSTWMLIRLMQMQDEKYRRFGEQTGSQSTCPACGEVIPRTDAIDRCPVCGAAVVADFLQETNPTSAPPALER